MYYWLFPVIFMCCTSIFPGGSMSLGSKFNVRAVSFIESEINKIVNEIAWIDARLLQLDDSDEGETERRLLVILRKHLVKDLYELAGFIWEGEDVEAEEALILSSALGEPVKAES